MAEPQARRPSIRWWVIALLLGTLIWAFFQGCYGRMKPLLEEWGVVPPSWSTGDKAPGGQWAPREFVPDRPGPSLREVGRLNCALVYEVAWFPDGERIAISTGVWLPGKGPEGQSRTWCILDFPGLRDTGQGWRGGMCLEVSSRGAIALTTYRKDTPRRGSRIEAYAPDATTPSLGFDVSGTDPQMAFTADGSRLVTVTPEGLLQVWETETWKEVGALTLPRANWEGAGLDIEARGRVAVLGRPECVGWTPLIIDLSGPVLGEPIELPRLPLGSSVPAISPDGCCIAMQTRAAGQGASPIVYDREAKTVRWKRQWRISNHPLYRGEIARLSRFSPDGRLLAICGDNGHVGLFDARDGALYDQRYEFDPHTTCVRWSPDGTMVAFGGNGGLVVYEVVRPSGWK